MTAWVALLRGVNVGGRNKVPMAEWRSALTAAGFEHVKTLLQSGNALFAASAAEVEIATRVSEIVTREFGVTVPCVVADRKTIDAIIKADPLPQPERDGSKYFATVLSGVVPKESAWTPESLDPGNIVARGRAVYQWTPVSVLDSPVILPKLEKQWSLTGTARNWNTLIKIAAGLAEIEELENS